MLRAFAGIPTDCRVEAVPLHSREEYPAIFAVYRSIADNQSYAT